MFLPHPRVKLSIVGGLRDREVACSTSDRQGSNFESCVWRTVSSHSSHHPQEVLLAQFSLYVHKGGLKPDSFHFILSYVGLYPIVSDVKTFTLYCHYYVEVYYSIIRRSELYSVIRRSELYSVICRSILYSVICRRLPHSVVIVVVVCRSLSYSVMCGSSPL